MAAAIKDKLGVEANLREGHGAIFEVASGGRVLYTNNRKCGNLPRNEDIVGMIEGYRKNATATNSEPSAGSSGGGCCR